MLPKMPKIPLPKKPAVKATKQDLEVTIVMMGGRRCGKTSVLASMQKCFEEKFNGQSPLKITSADEYTLGAIEKKRGELVGYFNKKLWFCPEVTPTEGILPYRFNVGLRDKPSRIRTTFVDFPGEWLGGNVDPDDWQRLKEDLKKSKIVLIAIDTPYLIEYEGSYNEMSNRCYRTCELLKECEFSDSGSGLLLLVPLKCEKYAEENRMNEVFSSVKEAYKDLIQYVGGNEQREYLAAITPILTLGGASFSHFDFEGGEIKMNEQGIPDKAIFMFSGSEKYEPKNCDMPLLFVLAYTLAMVRRAKERKKIPGVGAVVDWFQESILNWPTADDYLKEYDSIVQTLRDEKAKGTFAVLNKSRWLQL